VEYAQRFIGYFRGRSLQEIENLEKKKNSLEKNFNENTDIEEKYEKLKIEVQDISTRNKENLDSLSLYRNFGGEEKFK